MHNGKEEFRNLESFCLVCKKITKTKVTEKTEDITVGRYTFPVKLQYCTCEKCNNLVEHQYVDQINAKITSEEYRKASGIISNEKIHRILETLDITTGELSEMCGFPVNRILPFLYGNINPTKADSDILEKIYEDNKIDEKYNEIIFV